MLTLEVKDLNTPVPFTHNIFLSEKELRGEVGPLGGFFVMHELSQTSKERRQIDLRHKRTQFIHVHIP